MPLRRFGWVLGAIALVTAPAWAAPRAAETAALNTGLVLDARGLGYAPCMAPRLKDASGHNLLEGLSFDPDKVIADGFARWVRVYNSQEENPRIGDKPLVVKAARVEGGDALVVSADDAARIRAANARDHVLDRMRVLIVY